MSDPRKAPKRYFIVSSMDMPPSSVKVGSIITNLNRPDKPLSVFEPVILAEGEEAKKPSGDVGATGSEVLSADTPLFVTTSQSTGEFRRSNGWGLGIFATFLQAIQSLNLSSKGSGESNFLYSAQEITTSRFSPSAKYVRAAMADDEVAGFFKAGGSSARAYLIVAVKVARQLTIIRVDSDKIGGTGLVGLDIQAIEATMGLKGHYQAGSSSYHKDFYPGPIVFAFEVEQIRLTRKGEIERKDSDKLKGTMLGYVGDEEEELDLVAEANVDEEKLELFELQEVAGIDEDGESCQIYLPCEE